MDGFDAHGQGNPFDSQQLGMQQLGAGFGRPLPSQPQPQPQGGQQPHHQQQRLQSHFFPGEQGAAQQGQQRLGMRQPYVQQQHSGPPADAQAEILGLLKTQQLQQTQHDHVFGMGGESGGFDVSGVDLGLGPSRAEDFPALPGDRGFVDRADPHQGYSYLESAQADLDDDRHLPPSNDPSSFPPLGSGLAADEDRNGGRIGRSTPQQHSGESDFGGGESAPGLQQQQILHQQSQLQADDVRRQSGNEQWHGLLGLLPLIREPDTTAASVVGSDVTSMGLDLSSRDPLYANFFSPWGPGFDDVAPRRGNRINEPSSMDFTTPACFDLRAMIKAPGGASAPATSAVATLEQIPLPNKVAKFSDDTLFAMFYGMPRDAMQLLAASELFRRDWRYHRQHRLWLRRVPGTEPAVKSPTHERGSFIYFDVSSWERVRKDDFVVAYADLDATPPQLPQAILRTIPGVQDDVQTRQ